MEPINYIERATFDSSTHYSPKINKLSLFLSDIFAFFMSAYFAFLILGRTMYWPESASQFNQWQNATFYMMAVVTIFRFWGSFRHYTYRKPFWDELRDVLATITLMALLSLCINTAFIKVYSLSTWAVEWSLVLFLIPTFRHFTKTVLRKANVWDIPCIIIGNEKNARDALHAIQSEPSTGFDVQAFVHPVGSSNVNQVEGISYITQEEFLSKSQEFQKVFIALEPNTSQVRDEWIRLLTKVGINNISVIPALRGIPLYGTDMSNFFSHEVMMLRIKNNLIRPSSRLIKRAFDIFASAILLILFSPLFAYIAKKVSQDGGSATYGHERVGLNGKKFKCLKFRSMVMNSQEVLQELLENDPQAREEWNKEFKLKNDPRVTKIGAFLRKTSLDELPQLWNVFKGEMSLVGPRPVIDEELLRYGDDVHYYHMAKPGMSGLWQVSGRSDTDYDTRVYLDSWYVKNWSLWYDVVILFKTAKVVINRDGAY